MRPDGSVEGGSPGRVALDPLYRMHPMSLMYPMYPVYPVYKGDKAASCEAHGSDQHVQSTQPPAPS